MDILFIPLPLLSGQDSGKERGLLCPLPLQHPTALREPKASQLKVITSSPGTVPSDLQTVTYRPSR